MMDIATLTVMRGEVDRLPGLLANLTWASERHFVETGDPNDALSNAERVRVHHHPLPLGEPFDAARSVALAHIQAKWVLVVDTDERIPASLVEFLELKLPEWEARGVQAAWLARRNHVLGQPLLHSSAWPDYQLRIMRREVAAFSDQIHSFGPSGLTMTEHVPPIDALSIQHFNFESTADFVTKLNVYSSIEAVESKDTSAPSVVRALWKAGRETVTRFVRMKGYRDGAEGAHFAILLGLYRYLIETKRWENRRP